MKFLVEYTARLPLIWRRRIVPERGLEQVRDGTPVVRTGAWFSPEPGCAKGGRFAASDGGWFDSKIEFRGEMAL